jgi:hypothetical protein
MLPKGKCICMLKRKFCVAIFWFLTIVILFVYQFTIYIPQKRKQNLQIRSLYHSCDRIVAALRPLQIYTECEYYRSSFGLFFLILIKKNMKLTACMYIRVMISYVRKYLLCSFRKINTNLLYIHNSYMYLASVVRRLSSVVRRPSVNFSYFNLLLWNNWTKWNQTWQKASI